MWQDPIVEEIHQYREAYAKQFNNDVWAIYEDLKAKEKQSQLEGRRFASFCATDTQRRENSEVDESRTD
jgi:hypothetical protein